MPIRIQCLWSCVHSKLLLECCLPMRVHHDCTLHLLCVQLAEAVSSGEGAAALVDELSEALTVAENRLDEVEADRQVRGKGQHNTQETSQKEATGMMVCHTVDAGAALLLQGHEPSCWLASQYCLI